MSLQKGVMEIYSRMPSSVKKKMVKVTNVIPLDLLYGKDYRRWKKFILESQYWSDEQKKEYELHQLRETLECAYYHTQYYKRLFDDCGFDVSSFRYIDQMEKIPYLTKKIIQENLESMVNRQVSDKVYHYFTTGGSTGIPMGFYRMNADKFKEAAFVNYMWSMVGYRHTSKTAVLRGAYLGDKGVFYQDGNRLYLSAYHMTDEQMEQQYYALVQYKPEYLHVYPSAIHMLSDYILRKHLPPINSIKAVLTASENLYPYQRKMIYDAFRCKIYDFYGHSEHACMAGECEHNEKYHVYWQYGFTELLNPQGGMAEKEGEIVEIIATTYNNAVMPLIRYRTMDLAEYAEGYCECGRNYQLLNRIEGRLQEMLVTSKGRHISMVSMNMHDEIFDHVRQFQFYQDNVEECVLNIVKNEQYTEEDEQMIYYKIKEKLGDELKLRIKYVEEIPKTRSGKHRFLIQKLPVAFGNDAD